MGLLARIRKEPAPVGDLPWAVLRERATTSLRLQTQAHERRWNIGMASWAVDLGTGVITFRNADVVVTATFQVVGTLAPDGSWLWGWDHPSVPPGLGQHAALARAYGERNSVPQLVIRKAQATEDEAWGYAAIASLLAGAGGAYRGTSGDAAVFMTLGTIELTKISAAQWHLPADRSPTTAGVSAGR